MTMNNEVLLAEENMDLCIVIDLQERKRMRFRKPIIHENGNLSVEEAISLMQTTSTASIASTAAPSAEAGLQRKRASPRCSNCHQIGHIRTSCPSRHI